jgi:riboflavin biosynthesis pyrimidine reductase
VTATPEAVTITAAAGQPLPSQLVLIRSADEAAVAIESAEADDPAVTCRWAAGPGNMATLRVLVDRGKMKDPKLSATLRVVVNGPVHQTVSIPVRCAASQP